MGGGRKRERNGEEGREGMGGERKRGRNGEEEREKWGGREGGRERSNELGMFQEKENTQCSHLSLTLASPGQRPVSLAHRGQREPFLFEWWGLSNKKYSTSQTQNQAVTCPCVWWFRARHIPFSVAKSMTLEPKSRAVCSVPWNTVTVLCSSASAEGSPPMNTRSGLLSVFSQLIWVMALHASPAERDKTHGNTYIAVH